MHNPAWVAAPSDGGFTLAEMIVAMSLSIVVIGGALTALNTSARLVDATRIISDTNQGIQIAMSLMVRDFVQTGESIPKGGIPFPVGNGATLIVRPGPPGSAFTFPLADGTIPALMPGGSMGPTVLGVQTDVVTLLSSDPTIRLNEFLLAGIAADGSTMTVDARTVVTGPDGIKVGDLILFTNPNGNAVQMVTAVDGSQTITFAAGDPLGFNQRNATEGTIIQLQSGVDVFPPTTASRIQMISYYIDVVTDAALPRLVRRINAGPGLAISLGIENLQFTFDLVDGVTNPSNVQTVAAPNSPNQIRKANLFLLARSLDLNLHTREYFRNSTATAVGLRSLSFVDRYE